MSPPLAGEVLTDVDEVWLAYQRTRADTLNGVRPQTLTRARRELIAGRIKSHGLPAVMAAVQGWRHDPWYRGEDGATRPYGGELEAVLRVGRNGDRVERFAELEATGGPPDERTARLARLEAWMNEPDDLGGAP